MGASDLEDLDPLTPTPTPLGASRTHPHRSWEEPVYYGYSKGWQYGPLGKMWRPMYYNSGWAVHGSTSIPPWPASHGCVRLSVRAMNMLWSTGTMYVGSRVRITTGA